MRKRLVRSAGAEIKKAIEMREPYAQSFRANLKHFKFWDCLLTTVSDVCTLKLNDREGGRLVWLNV